MSLSDLSKLHVHSPSFYWAVRSVDTWLQSISRVLLQLRRSRSRYLRGCKAWKI